MSLKLAADENAKLCSNYSKNQHEGNNRIITLGFFRSAMILYASSIELILKARALYLEKENILSGKIANFNDFLTKWNGQKYGHDFLKIIEHYNIELTSEELEFIDNFKQFSVWAGRYPYPKNESEIIKMENNTTTLGNLRLSYSNSVQDFIDRQISIMNE